MSERAPLAPSQKPTDGQDPNIIPYGTARNVQLPDRDKTSKVIREPFTPSFIGKAGLMGSGESMQIDPNATGHATTANIPGEGVQDLDDAAWAETLSELDALDQKLAQNQADRVAK